MYPVLCLRFDLVPDECKIKPIKTATVDIISQISRLWNAPFNHWACWISFLLNLVLLTNINWKIYCPLGCGHFVVMAAKTPLSFVHLHIVNGFVKLPVHCRNSYVYFIAANIAIVKEGELDVGSKYYLQHGSASVPFPSSLWSLFPIKTWIRNCKQTQELLSACQMNLFFFFMFVWRCITDTRI